MKVTVLGYLSTAVHTSVITKVRGLLPCKEAAACVAGTVPGLDRPAAHPQPWFCSVGSLIHISQSLTVAFQALDLWAPQFRRWSPPITCSIPG